MDAAADATKASADAVRSGAEVTKDGFEFARRIIAFGNKIFDDPVLYHIQTHRLITSVYYIFLLCSLLMLFYYTIFLYYLLLLFYYTFLLYFSIILFYYTFFLYFLPILFYDPFLLYSLLILPHYTVLRTDTPLRYHAPEYVVWLRPRSRRLRHDCSRRHPPIPDHHQSGPVGTPAVRVWTRQRCGGRHRGEAEETRRKSAQPVRLGDGVGL